MVDTQPHALFQQKTHQEIEMFKPTCRRAFSQISLKPLSSCSTLIDQLIADDASTCYDISFSLERTFSQLEKSSDSFSSEDLTKNQSKNLFLGCKNWELPQNKGNNPKKSKSSTEFNFEQKNYCFDSISNDQNMDNCEVDESIENLFLDFDSQEWFDTDISDYENVLVSQ